MNNEELSSFYNDRRNDYRSRADALRLLLMPFAFIVLLGFPGKYGSYVTALSNFVPPVFFILYGFFTLVPRKSKRYRNLQRSLIRALRFFAAMFVSYIVLNIIYLTYIEPEKSLLGLASILKHAVFNFFVLNVWPLPVGSSIWFVQSLIYAYLFFLIAETLRFNRYYIPILIVLIAFSLATGEFAGFFGFPHWGYSYIPGGAVTRAIPYMLIGMLLRRYIDQLPKIPQYVYITMFPVGLLLAIAEIQFLKYLGKLVYVGHTIGFGIMAVSLCCITLSKAKVANNFLSNHGRNYSRRLYALCQPVALICWIATDLIKPEYLSTVKEFSFVISFVISFLIALSISLAKYFTLAWRKNHSPQKSSQEMKSSNPEKTEQTE